MFLWPRSKRARANVVDLCDRQSKDRAKNARSVAMSATNAILHCFLLFSRYLRLLFCSNRDFRVVKLLSAFVAVLKHHKPVFFFSLRHANSRLLVCRRVTRFLPSNAFFRGGGQRTRRHETNGEERERAERGDENSLGKRHFLIKIGVQKMSLVSRRFFY